MARFKLDVANLKEKDLLPVMEFINDSLLKRFHTISEIALIEPSNAQQFYNADDLACVALNIVDDLVKFGLCPDCTDTEDSTEFDYQDIIRQHLEKEFLNETTESAGN